ncbi:MAG: ARMT1-like domain-containing protein [Nitrososphaerota archaeon]
MKLSIDCVPCILKTVNLASKLAVEDEQTRKEILVKAFQIISSNWDKTPIEISLEIHRMIRRSTGINDPFKDIKNKSNEFVRNLFPMMKKLVDVSREKLEVAVKLAIAGNTIDIVTVEFQDFKKNLFKTFRKKLAVNDYSKFKEAVSSCNNLLYFLDNAGEIYTDKLLIEAMLDIRNREFKNISIVVRGGPIVNDATYDDLKAVGLDDLPNTSIVFASNGEEGSGISPNSRELDDLINSHDLVIAKGMANYEVMENKRNIFFLLIAKCAPIAGRLGVKPGDPVLKYSAPR